MGAGGLVPGDERVPAADINDNILAKQVLGNKADAAVSSVVSTASAIAYLKGILGSSILATGTFSTSSATVPADTGRTEGDGYWNGSWLIPLSGTVINQPRQIAAFANTGGVFTLDSEHPFTAAPGTVDYIIVGSGSNLVPATDSAADQTMAHVIGKKDDTIGGDSLVALAKILQAAVDIIDAFHDVPSQDSSDDNQIRDVVGKKDDTVGGDSLVAIAKQVIVDVTSAVDEPPTAKSLHDILHKDGNFTYDNTTDSLEAIADAVGAIATGSSVETVGPFSYLDAGAEQDVMEDAVTTRRHVSVEVDFTTMTVDGTVRIYRKVDGSTYRLWLEQLISASGTETVFDARFTTNQEWKMTYQEVSDEGAARSVPFNTIVEVIE